ncbi:hypothetical protein [Streptomyces sp. ICBB 8177]|uniref:hypothetical protein n=1 Tax=Streptomyces sp. ICBB 8177 TaxID=563922 RepID=UPI001F546607|nr:hypothetical protein [Streptomyces sp. ICBB 8177]
MEPRPQVESRTQARAARGRTSLSPGVGPAPQPAGWPPADRAPDPRPDRARAARPAECGAGHPQVARLLRTGPFAEALRAAIAASGLSLERVQDRLRRRGTTVSAATLSSWQSGRNRPERPSSLLALTALEDVLGLPQGALAALLGPPRPRGRRVPGAARRSALADVWSGLDDVAQALRRVDTRWDSSLTRLSSTIRIELDERGRERSKWARQLLLADRDGPDRWVTVYRLERPGPPPLVRAAPPCRTGRVVEVPESGLLVAELLFDRPLVRGETIIVESTLEHRAPRPFSTRIESTLHVPVREYVLEVRFDPAALPVTCHSFRSAGLDSRPQEKLLRLDAAGAVHAVALAAGPCRFGIRWSWDDAHGTGDA